MNKWDRRFVISSYCFFGPLLVAMFAALLYTAYKDGGLFLVSIIVCFTIFIGWLWYCLAQSEKEGGGLL